VAQKLGKSPFLLEILYFMLEKHNKFHSIFNSRDNDDERQKIIKLNEINILRYDEDGRSCEEKENYLSLDIIKVDTILIKADGEVVFCHENKPDFYVHDLYTKIYDGLFLKFKKEIKQNAELFVQELEADINSFDKEIAEIKDKGQNQLALIELSNQNNGEQE
jgi:hypothetical protein